jgi:hypothetical protein
VVCYGFEQERDGSASPRFRAIQYLMIDESTQRMVDSSRPSQTSWKPSELLANYERLLGLYVDQLQKDEFNPYQSIPLLFLKSFSPAFQMRFWKHATPFFKIPNTLRQDLAGGALILQELEGLDDQTLRAVAECSRINLRRLIRRTVFGWLPRLTGAVVFLLALPKAIKESVGTDIFAALPSTVVSYVAPLIVGLLVGSIGNLILSLPWLGIVRALDDLIAIAVVHRGTSKLE